MRLSIPKKLLIIILFPLLLDIGEIVLFDFSANTFSAVRAYVNGESLWSKAQKDAFAALQRYITTQEESEYGEYLTFLEVPLGDRAARLALEENPPHLEAADRGFIQGGNHPDDVRAMSLFFLRFRSVPYVREAFDVWPQADEKLIALQALGEDIHSAIENGAAASETALLADELERLNVELTALEIEFSHRLGVASRIAKNVLITTILAVSLFFFVLSIIVPLYLGRGILQSVQKLKHAAQAFKSGTFTKVTLDSNDELEELAHTFNEMGEKLESSYRELEHKVQERTEHLETNKQSLELEISQRAELEQRLRMQAEVLRRSDRMKDEFLATFAHELRNPLSPIVMTLELIEQKKMSGPELTRSIEIIKRQAGYMTRIVNDLLDVTRLSLGKIQLRKERVDIRDLVDDVILSLKPTIEDREQILSTKVPSEPLTVEVDVLRISQILINLLSNASKFTPENGAIDVHVYRIDNDIFVTITDTGIGIAPDDTQHIFDPFFQGTPTLEGSKVGLGIGLTLSQQLARLHAGSIMVTSEGSGTGSTFTLRLPINIAI